MSGPRVYVHGANEQWIIDRMKLEYEQHTSLEIAERPEDADVVWILADFAWRHLLPFLQSNHHAIIVTTVHHLVPEKLDVDDFALRDRFTDFYTVPNAHTLEQVRALTSKKIGQIGYWCNPRLWFNTHPNSSVEDKKEALRVELGLPEMPFLIGSFQRDTEGAGIPGGVFLPKLEKGPDTFVEFCEHARSNSPVHVVLAGWRRQYVMQELEKRKIPFTYFEMPDTAKLNKLYNAIDLYVVSSRFEGGPQALLECGLTGTPVISRDIGMARDVLPSMRLNNDLRFTVPCVPDVEAFRICKHVKRYDDYFDDLFCHVDLIKYIQSWRGL